MDMGADIEGENSEGETPLFSAVKSNNFHAAQLIIEAGANINHKNKMLLTSFQLIEVCIFIRYSIFLCDHKLDLFVFIFLVQNYHFTFMIYNCFSLFPRHYIYSFTHTTVIISNYIPLSGLRWVDKQWNTQWKPQEPVTGPVPGTKPTNYQVHNEGGPE